MNATTPPKLMPPFQSTAASGTLPIEHTKLTTETRGPTNGPQIAASVGSRVTKNACHDSFGTHDPSAPARTSPPTTSFQIDAQSIRK